MAAYPALRIQRTGPVRWRGRRSDSGRRSGLAHQPARAVACLGAVAAFLPIFSSICIPLLECEPNQNDSVSQIEIGCVRSDWKRRRVEEVRTSIGADCDVIETSSEPAG